MVVGVFRSAREARFPFHVTPIRLTLLVRPLQPDDAGDAPGLQNQNPVPLMSTGLDDSASIADTSQCVEANPAVAPKWQVWLPPAATPLVMAVAATESSH